MPQFTTYPTVTTVQNGDTVLMAQGGAVKQISPYNLTYTVKVADYGAVGNGTTNDSTAFANALAAVPILSGTIPILELESKVYNIGASGTVAWNLNKTVFVKGNGAKLLFTGTGIGIQVAAFNVCLENLDVVGSWTYTGPASALVGTGIKQANFFDCRYYNVGVEGFGVGYHFNGNGAGCSYTDVYGPRVTNCLYGMKFRAEAAGGSFVTAINVFGGKITIGPFTSLVGVRDVSIEDAGLAMADGINFYGTVIEGLPEKNLYCQGTRCSFNNCYWDVGGGSDNIEFTAASSYNILNGGSALDLVSVLDSGTRNVIIRPSSTFQWPALIDISGSNASQIKFAAAGNASSDQNTIDFFFKHQREVAPNLPTVEGGTTPGAGTYTRQRTGWGRIGDLVMYSVDLAWTAHTGSGVMIINLNGLPACASAATEPIFAGAISSSLLVAAAAIDLQAEVVPGVNQIRIYSQTSGGAQTGVALPGAGSVKVTGFYRV